jgi:RNA 2',3'-cyclic 3'-phosphodiesterase
MWIASLANLPLGPHAKTPVGQVHLTLQFIGAASPRDLPSIEESIERSTSGIPRFTLRGIELATFPPRGEPRLIAVLTDAPPPLLELHGRLARRLAKSTRERPGDRFLPHFTLARFNEGPRAERLSAAIEGPGFEVGEIRLMRSVLTPTGAVHQLVRRFELS